ncbi:hypothetical protein H4Q26_002094 [Puccinia striiformis f. sp. tritici PST-130]|nr:hypothetical protein H4Q26_002094 [Puccinia striiformis f. sp. tritici PST-130]
MPTIFLLKPLIDPVTFAKAVVDKADPLVFAPAEQLDSPAGGSNGYDFDIATYWPALTSECTRRRYARLDEWVKMGKTVGSSELKDPSQTYRSSSSASQSSASTSLAPSTAGTSAHPDSVCTHDTSAREPIPQALVAVSQITRCSAPSLAV